jgi:hypothetical protein
MSQLQAICATFATRPATAHSTFTGLRDATQQHKSGGDVQAQPQYRLPSDLAQTVQVAADVRGLWKLPCVYIIFLSRRPSHRCWHRGPPATASQARTCLLCPYLRPSMITLVRKGVDPSNSIFSVWFKDTSLSSNLEQWRIVSSISTIKLNDASHSATSMLFTSMATRLLLSYEHCFRYSNRKSIRPALMCSRNDTVTTTFFHISFCLDKSWLNVTFYCGTLAPDEI